MFLQLQEVTIGLILISVVTYFCFAFSGFIVQPIPKYFVWLHKISYYSLAYTILVKNEFTGLNIQCASYLLCVPRQFAQCRNSAAAHYFPQTTCSIQKQSSLIEVPQMWVP